MQKEKKKKRLTCFDDIHADILNAGFNLLPHKLGRDIVYSLDACCVLHRQRRRRRHGVASMSRQDFLVSL